MPRIADRYTDCAVYIYQSRRDAELGVHQGGSGFIVMVPFENNPVVCHPYIVTNQHVVIAAGDPVIRLNRKDGGTECLETKADQWKQHREGDDISVLPFDIEPDNLKHSGIPLRSFVTKSLIEIEDIGIGDDTIMIGRFINHEGKQQNAPAVRFGNIAMMATEKIKTPVGLEQEGFLVETRSLPGYSGSAVLIYSPCAMNDMSVRRLGIDKASIKPLLSGRTAEEQEHFHSEMTASLAAKGPYLLGIDFCHIPRQATVRRRITGGTETTDLFVDENTGMAGVIPAWRIIEVLFREDLIEARRKAERDLAEASSGCALD